MALTEVNSLGIKDLEVKTADIAADAVTSAKIADDQIDSEHYVNASIDHAHLADDCVDGDNIADNSVGLAAMAHGTDGNLITFDASGAPAYVATGNDGQVLTSTGAGSPPAFETISTTNEPFRNLVINGACNVAQRATSKSTHTGHGYFTVDRFYTSIGGENEGREEAQITLTSSDTGPWAKGFRNAFQVTNGNQTSTDAGDYLWAFAYYIEAQDVASSGWEYNNTSSYLTISFWVKSSVAQNFYGFFRTSDGTSKYRPFETGSLSANTWTKITKSIPGHADIQIDNNTGHGFQVYFYGYAGTDKTDSGISLDTWYSWPNDTQTTPDWSASMDDWWRTNNATLAFTGLQVEVGATATEFEHRSFGEELLRCLRYYEKSYPYTVAPGTGGDNGRRLRRICGDANNTTAIIEETYNVEKRATPTLTTYATDGTSGKMTVYNYGSTTNHQNASTYGATARGFEVNSSGNSMNAAAVFWEATADF